MEDYNKNLILKHQKNLVSSLGMKFDEQLNKYLFVHKKKVTKHSFWVVITLEEYVGLKGDEETLIFSATRNISFQLNNLS